MPDPQNSQPHIVVIAHDNYYQYYIAIEKGIYMDYTDVVTAVFLLASDYVFNPSYHPKVHELLRFIQEKVSGIPSNKKGKILKSPAASSHICGITSVYETMKSEKDHGDVDTDTITDTVDTD